MKAGHAAIVAACLLGLAGCAGHRERLHQALLDPAHPALARDLEAQYVVRCPDVLEIKIEGRPALSGRYEVGPDGRIALAPSARVAALGAPRVAALLARELRVPAENVSIQVAEHRSQSLFLVGEVEAQRQVIDYRGPETVVDLLRRIDIGSKAALGEVRVVRGHIADGKPPEVFSVDLEAILLRRDLQTNVRLEPSDHIHIAERQPSKVACYLPPWVRPVYESCFGIK